MEKLLAKIISVVLHPLLIPTYAMLLLFSIPAHFNFTLTTKVKTILLVFVFVVTFLFPGLLMLIFKRLKIIDSLDMSTAKDRTLPLISMAVVYSMLYYLLEELPVPVYFLEFLLGSALLVLISLVVNHVEKISLHMVALGGLFGMFAGIAMSFQYDVRMVLYQIALPAGFAGFARLSLQAHRPSQVYSGFGLGVLVMLALFWFV